MSTRDGIAYTISYGKIKVPVYRVYAHPLASVAPIPESGFSGRPNIVLATEIDVEVFGDNFLPAYTEGDNSMVVATDSMKNFILRETLGYDGATLEGLLGYLGERFLQTYPQMLALKMSARQRPFSPQSVPHEGAFQPSSVLFSEERGDHVVATLDCHRGQTGFAVTDHLVSCVDLHLVKITGSAFTHFVRDDYTTLPERGDRPLFIYMDVSWRYSDVAHMLTLSPLYVAPEQVRDLICTVFDRFVSESIQHLMYEMGRCLLERFPQLAHIAFDGQNHTWDPTAVSIDDPKVKVYTDPFVAYGRLQLTMARDS